MDSLLVKSTTERNHTVLGDIPQSTSLTISTDFAALRIVMGWILNKNGKKGSCFSALMLKLAFSNVL